MDALMLDLVSAFFSAAYEAERDCCRVDMAELLVASMVVDIRSLFWLWVE